MENKKADVNSLTFLIIMMIACLLVGGFIGYHWGSSDGDCTYLNFTDGVTASDIDNAFSRDNVRTFCKAKGHYSGWMHDNTVRCYKYENIIISGQSKEVSVEYHYLYSELLDWSVNNAV